MNLQERAQVHQWAQSLFELPNFYVLDTETTGVGKRDEVIQIGIVDKFGETVLSTLVKPTCKVSPQASAINGITNEMLIDAPTFIDVYFDLSVKLAGQVLIAYNVDFDWRLLQQSLLAYRLPSIRPKTRACAMKQYAIYRGQWNRNRGSYRWHKLAEAAAHERIPVIGAHDALSDARMTHHLIKVMAEVE